MAELVVPSGAPQVRAALDAGEVRLGGAGLRVARAE